MTTIAYTVWLKDDPEIIRRYDAYHAEPWPEVAAWMAAQGVQRCRIYRFDRMLFMLLERDDDAAPAPNAPLAVAVAARYGAWDALMYSMQEPVPGAPLDGAWVEMAQVYDYQRNPHE